MKLKCTILILHFLLPETIKCENSTITEMPPLTTEITTEVITETTVIVEDTTIISTESATEQTTANPARLCLTGLYAGCYYNNFTNNPYNIHYIHGSLQLPNHYYYFINNYYHHGENPETFDVYLSYGLSKISDKDFIYTDFHHYYHNINRTIKSNDTIQSDNVIRCHPSALYICPENTETVCLMNGTIFCMSKINIVELCSENDTMSCVSTTVPCVRMCSLEKNYLEEIFLPCLANISIKDIYEDKSGNWTISRVGDTFILVPALKVEEKTFCVSVIVDPTPEQIIV